jgi:hypothetical protein
MISDDLRKYINMVDQESQDDQLFEMANVFPKKHGIDNIVIWVGKSTKQHGLRVKVSNIPNKMDVNNCFVIQMPSLDYDPAQVASWIDRKIIKQILSWIVLNQKLLVDYENGVIDDTEEFLTNISKV